MTVFSAPMASQNERREGRHVDGHDPRTIALEQIGDQQAHQALAQHQHPIAQARLGLAHRLQGDRAEGCIGRLPVRHRVRHPAVSRSGVATYSA